jgi:hypothetical protein
LTRYIKLRLHPNVRTVPNTDQEESGHKPATSFDDVDVCAGVAVVVLLVVEVLAEEVPDGDVVVVALTAVYLFLK